MIMTNLMHKFLFYNKFIISLYMFQHCVLIIRCQNCITQQLVSRVVGPCHHGMARPQVADRGTASDKEGSCE